MPFGSDAVVIVTAAGGGVTVTLSVCWTVCAGTELSRSENVCVVVPSAVGVPVTAPLAALSVRPFGNAGATDHVYGGVPPEPMSEAEYG